MDRRSAELQFTVNDAADVRKGALALNDVYNLGRSSYAPGARMGVELEYQNGCDAQFKVVARVKKPSGGVAPSWKPIPYVGRFVNGAVGTDASVSTTITTDSLLSIAADDVEIGLQLSTVPTVGSVNVTARPD